LLGLVADQAIIPLVVTALFLECQDGLKRPDQLTAMGASTDSIDGFLAALAAGSEAVESHFWWRPQTRDPGDDMVLEAAINGFAAADYAQCAALRRCGVSFWRAVLGPADALRKSNREQRHLSAEAALSIKRAAERLAKEDGVSLNQWISVAMAQKVGTVEIAAEFLRRRAVDAKVEDLMQFLAVAPDLPPFPGDETP
jgi:hypothetical protein